MESFEIAMSEDEPFLNANAKTGEINFGGRILTYLEVLTDQYYAPFASWFKEFSSKGISNKLTINLSLDYFNTAAEKVLVYPILKLIEEYQPKYSQVTVNWYYPSYDDDMLDAGQVFESLTELTFNYIPVEGEE